MISLIEVLARPLRENDSELATRYKEILMRSDNLLTLPLSESIALQAAEMRARHNLRIPDAIQVVTALASGADTLITNDKRLHTPPELKRIVLDDLLSQLESASLPQN